MAAVPPGEAGMLTLRLAGQMPSGKNQIRMAMIRGRIMKFPDARFKRWRTAGAQQLLGQRGTWTTFEGPTAVRVRYWPGDRIRRDVPGLMDALCHLLEHCTVCKKKNKTCPIPIVRDDSLLTQWDWRTMELDRANPRIEIDLIPLTEPA